MMKITVFLLLAVGLIRGQLNFEGNPLTENTEYTAEESHISERTARREEILIDDSTKLRPAEKETLNKLNEPREEENRTNYTEKPQRPVIRQNSEVLAPEENTKTARQLSRNVYSQGINSMNNAQVALNTFLNSKTPEESRVSLEHYLRSKEVSESKTSGSPVLVGRSNQVAPPNQVVPANQVLPPNQVVPANQVLPPNQVVPANQVLPPSQVLAANQVVPANQVLPPIQVLAANQVLPANQVLHANQGQLTQQHFQATSINRPNAIIDSSPVNQQLTAQLLQQHQPLQGLPSNQQLSQLNNQAYGPIVAAQEPQPMPNVIAPHLRVQQHQLQQIPYAPGIQARNDLFYPAGWHNRVRRIRGKPAAPPFVQPKIGPGPYYAPNLVPFQKKGPVELIYTRPPGFHRRPPRMESHSPPFKEAPWVPEEEYPPSNNEIRYSQLYAQSYDPLYYDYIAKTGKIKPYLYGKLGKHHEKKEDSIWMELYRGFTKHGLKKLMTPSFLLGMTLPVVTLMLSVLVQKRSLSRSDSRGFSQEDDSIQDYLERLQRAMECYENKRRMGDTSMEGC